MAKLAICLFALLLVVAFVSAEEAAKVIGKTEIKPLQARNYADYGYDHGKEYDNEHNEGYGREHDNHNEGYGHEEHEEHEEGYGKEHEEHEEYKPEYKNHEEHEEGYGKEHEEYKTEHEEYKPEHKPEHKPEYKNHEEHEEGHGKGHEEHEEKHDEGYGKEDKKGLKLGPRPTKEFVGLIKQFSKLYHCIGRFYNKRGANAETTPILGESILTNIVGEEKKKSCYDFQVIPSIANANAKTYRVTVVFADGTVLYDSLTARDPTKTLDNHNTRPEVFSAILSRNTGFSTRVSATSGSASRYMAKTFFLKADRSQFITVRVSQTA